MGWRAHMTPAEGSLEAIQTLDGWDATFEIDAEAGALVVRSLTLRPSADPDAGMPALLSGHLLRKISPSDALDLARSVVVSAGKSGSMGDVDAIGNSMSDATANEEWRAAFRQLTGPIGAHWRRHRLAYVADVYVRALQRGGAVNLAVAEALGCSAGQARERVREARAAGMLTQLEDGRGRGQPHGELTDAARALLDEWLASQRVHEMAPATADRPG